MIELKNILTIILKELIIKVYKVGLHNQLMTNGPDGNWLNSDKNDDEVSASINL